MLRLPATDVIQKEIDEKRAATEDAAAALRRRSPRYQAIGADDRRAIGGAQNRPDGDQSQEPRAAQQPDNPAYIELQVQISGADSELAALRTQRDEFRDRITDYEKLIARAPETEKQLLALTRDYEIARHDYDETRQKQAEAQRAVVIEDQQRAERYVMQRAAGLPSGPAQPTHLTLLAIGLFLSITAALGQWAYCEKRSTSLSRGARDLRTMLSTPPIAVIPMIENTTRHQTARSAARRAGSLFRRSGGVRRRGACL